MGVGDVKVTSTIKSIKAYNIIAFNSIPRSSNTCHCILPPKSIPHYKIINQPPCSNHYRPAAAQHLRSSSSPSYNTRIAHRSGILYFLQSVFADRQSRAQQVALLLMGTLFRRLRGPRLVEVLRDFERWGG